jgi:hypothetical protein
MWAKMTNIFSSASGMLVKCCFYVSFPESDYLGAALGDILTIIVFSKQSIKK